MAKADFSKMAPPRAPDFLQLHPSNRCNASCDFCWLHNRKQESAELPDKRWLKLADEICSLGFTNITLSGGGEPLLRRNLVIQMMEKFTKNKMNGALITNGTLITEALARRMVELQWEAVQVSIHAPKPKLNDYLMGKEGGFRLIMRGIENLNRCKRALKSHFPMLVIRVLLTRENITELPTLIRLVGPMEVSRVLVREVNEGVPAVQGKHSIRGGDYHALKKATEDAKRIAHEMGIRLDFDLDVERFNQKEKAREDDKQEEPTPRRCAEHRLEPACPIPFRELVVFANGTVSPCCNFLEWQFKRAKERKGWLEDVNKRSLSDIWQNGFRLLRENMFAKKGLNQMCRTCSPDMISRLSQDRGDSSD